MSQSIPSLAHETPYVSHLPHENNIVDMIGKKKRYKKGKKYDIK
jgi:hypothetical protein